MNVSWGRAGRRGAWLAEATFVVALGAVERLLRLAVGVATASATALEFLRWRAEVWRAAASLSAAERARAAGRWRSVFEAAPLAMAKVTVEGRLGSVNSAMCALLGEPERALAGRRLSALVYPDDRPALGGPGHPGRSSRGTAKAEVRLVCAGGRLRWCELSSCLVRGRDGRPEYVLVSVVDITRHKRSEAALRDLATRDPLTGVANRRRFELDLARHLRVCAAEGTKGAVLVLDLDNFKQVNDTLGHEAGDLLVVEAALTIRRHLRDQDLVARLGGDEFAVVLHDGDAKAAEAVARKLVSAVHDEVRTTARPGAPAARVTASVGVAPLAVLAAGAAGLAELSAAAVLRAADEAMYRAKRSGRDAYALAAAGGGVRGAGVDLELVGAGRRR